ncbi:MAG TPA: amidohydrolase, partial [Phycicoccus sp.]|nr:amidohydrolase [Phycicoccus sp.]
MLVRQARLVPIGGRAAPVVDSWPVDLRIEGGRVTEIAPVLSPYAGEQVIDAGGRWAIPGLWDAHTHPVMWALTQR